MRFAAFFSGKKSPFQRIKQIWKKLIVARWRYDWCTNARENFQNLRKWVQSLCAPLRPFRSEVKEKFYNTLYIVDVHPYKNISLARYRVQRKTFKFVPVVLKAHGKAKSIKPCNSKKCFGGFLYGMICSCAPIFKFFSAPPDGASTEYQISNREFSDFLRMYYCDFLNNVYS